MIQILILFLLGTGTLLIVCLSSLYVYVKRVYGYFEKRGVPFDPPTFPFGSFTSTALLKQSFSSALAEIYAKNRSHKLVGFFSFWQKSVLLIDPDTIKAVLVKDFDIFQDRGVYYNKEKDPLSAHMFSLAGDEWKSLRSKLTPTFTSGKIKGMFPNVAGCANEMMNYVATLDAENKLVDCKTLFTRYGLAVIASTAFGLDSDALTNDDSMFVKMVHHMVAPTVGRMLALLVVFNAKLARMLNLRVVPSAVSQFFMRMAMDTVQYRESHSVVRNDYMQLLIQLKDSVMLDSKGSEVAFSDRELAAQAFVFIEAGSETTSSAMSFCLYELALNPGVQARLQAEVDRLPEISYDTVCSLEYLDMVLDETLRKYPGLGFLMRECSRDYLVPGTRTTIERGTQVLVSVQGLHHDPELFPEPDKFIPERFSKENKHNIQQYSYLPFGEGPRFCIGMRFGRVVVKTGLAVLLRHFHVHRTPSTPDPVQFEPRTLATSAVGGIWLRLEDRRTKKSHDFKG